MQFKSIALSSIFTFLLTACNSQNIQVDIDGGEQTPSYKNLVESEDLYNFYGHTYSTIFSSDSIANYYGFSFPTSDIYIDLFSEQYAWNNESKSWKLETDFLPDEDDDSGSPVHLFTCLHVARYWMAVFYS
ncbi:hypothetical protein [Catenovulum agarivorans]|uniref:hypothetical protein n=1 Tax=Catenovulum agarivorans TaxID=1172192 RepID=UPI00030AAA06|nr:hypothetical protein [Catenovulum agarivorans]